jgi:hypothetical protein
MSKWGMWDMNEFTFGKKTSDDFFEVMKKHIREQWEYQMNTKVKGTYKPMKDKTNEMDEYGQHMFEFNLTDYIGELYDLDVGSVASDRDTLDGVCTHEWKEYEGITQRYNYCIKCDIKKE